MREELLRGLAGVSPLLLGASKIHQLEDNLGTLDVHLSAEELRRLDELSPHASYDPNWFTTMLRDQATDKALTR